MNKASLVYIDESGFGYDMPRTHGYSEVGKCCFGTHDWNAKGRQNVLGALINSELTACGIIESNVDSEVFNTWLEKILITQLPKNSIVVMDNATFHKSKRTKELIEDHGHTLEYLPPYSPDLNPIEHKWAYAKSLRRKHNCDVLQLFQSHFS